MCLAIVLMGIQAKVLSNGRIFGERQGGRPQNSDLELYFFQQIFTPVHVRMSVRHYQFHVIIRLLGLE